MKLPWQKDDSVTAAEADVAPVEFVDRRRSVQWCASCRSPHGPFIFFENRKHYCERCSARIFALMGLQSAGRRADDLQYPERAGAGVVGGVSR